jgi:hypothetical protein
MHLQLLVPSLPTRVSRLEVRRWIKQPGDEIDFGDEICELEVREFTSVDRHVVPGDGTPGDRRANLKSRRTTGILVVVTASDAGRLVETVAPPGEIVEVGGLLGRITPASAEIDGALHEGLAFHAVADIVGGRDVDAADLSGPLLWRRRAGRLYRRTLAGNPRVKRLLQGRRTSARGADAASQTRLTDRHRSVRHPESLVVESLDAPSPRWGVHLVGACDLPAMLEPDPAVIDDVRGTMIIHRASTRISGARSDVLLQTLDDHPPSVIAEITDALGLRRDYFSPTAFVPGFEVPRAHLDDVPVHFTMLSAGADVVRPAYRHKQHGLIVDPGGYWLDGEVLTNTKQHEFRRYLAANFERIGKLSVDEHAANYRRLIPLLRERTGGDVMVFNVLTIEPGDRTHNYQLRKVPEGARRRRFHLAQAELSAELGYHVVDIDRALKRAGVVGQVDFAHFPREQFPAVAGEAFAAFRQAGVL